MINKLDYWRDIGLGTHDRQARLLEEYRAGDIYTW